MHNLTKSSRYKCFERSFINFSKPVYIRNIYVKMGELNMGDFIGSPCIAGNYFTRKLILKTKKTLLLLVLTMQ